MITGKIINQSDNSAIPYTHIIINNSNSGTISNSEGKFELNLSDQPTPVKLTISSIGFKSTTISINKTKSKKYYHISLERKRIELDEFNLVYESAGTIMKKFQKNYFQ